MKLREQASLWCKILALLCVVLALNTLQQMAPQAINAMGVRGFMPSMSLILIGAPALLMFLFAAVLWSIAPFVAALMVSNETVEKLDAMPEAPALTLGGRATMKIALVILGLWLLLRSAVSMGTVFTMRVIVAGLSATQTNSVGTFYIYQMNIETMGAFLHLALGILFLILSRPISQRAFPN